MVREQAASQGRATLGVSSCLLGLPVRHDGRDKRNPLIVDLLARYFDFRPGCPEVEIGLGTPRPPIRLVATVTGIRARGVEDPGFDVTDRLEALGRDAGAGLAGLSGYIFKRGSPSCGLRAVPLVSADGQPAGDGRGVFAAALLARLPDLPVEEEHRLEDPVLGNCFVEAVLVFHRWQRLLAAGPDHAGLIDFHARHKFTLLAHDESVYRRLGPLVSMASAGRFAEVLTEYQRLLMQAMRRPVSTGAHVNTLLHVMGFFKRTMRADERAGLLAAIEAFRCGETTVRRPLNLIRRHLERSPDAYLARQYYLYPGPDEPELPLLPFSGHNGDSEARQDGRTP